MPEICTVLQQNKIGIISASGWLSITKHGNMNVKITEGLVSVLTFQIQTTNHISKKKCIEIPKLNND